MKQQVIPHVVVLIPAQLPVKLAKFPSVVFKVAWYFDDMKVICSFIKLLRPQLLWYFLSVSLGLFLFVTVEFKIKWKGT